MRIDVEKGPIRCRAIRPQEGARGYILERLCFHLAPEKTQNRRLTVLFDRFLVSSGKKSLFFSTQFCIPQLSHKRRAAGQFYKNSNIYFTL